ncbi:M13 family metallopeptidase [Phaeocystidibacter luteus]|uniref:M13 family metallopeptidase n=1 Tax=Phaeocystidibacter luteus TaxID=911197 RepID=A0A6N6RJA6_9FLAO|nr:M13 family metallopeptidase [Phaeocystidibacter luteus]KAB2813734.1 M13 family metallopeptidase [Phaeocystidibacter luteus]
MRKVVLSALGVAAIAVACTPKGESEVDPNTGFELSSLDSSYAPCDDFFHFSAQGWIDQNPIPNTESSWGKFNILARENQTRVRGIFEDLLAAETSAEKGSDAQLVGDLYRSGMDSLRIEELKFQPLEGMMAHIDEATSVEDWFRRASELQMSGIGMPISSYVSSDDKNASMNVLHIGQSGLGLPDRSYYFKEDSLSLYIQSEYRNFITKMFVMSGMDGAEAEKSAMDIYMFEKQLAGNMLTREQRRIPELRYNKMMYSELKSIAPGIPLDAYFKAKNIEPKNVIVTSLDYIKWMGQAAQSWDLNTLKVYSKWNIINGWAGELHHDAVQANFDFYSATLRGNKELQPRWRRVQGAMGGLDEQIGHLYVEEYFPAEYKERIEGMVEDLRSAFRVRINNLEWMSPATKEKALEKLESFTYKIGYPDKWADWSDLDINAEDYVTNLANLSAYITADNFAKMDQPVDKSEWFMGAHIVNAYYNPNFNEVVFPAGILQPPFFMPEADDAINYGAIGGVIGHEFTHGFDDQGAKYDKDGNLESWWTSEDSARFHDLTHKVVELYDSYEALPNEYVNGQMTLGENIADLGGLTLAYHAYLKHMEGKEAPAPIGGFTDKQRVFLGWAQVWQVHYTEEALRFRLNNDYHSPGEFRVIGPMSNMPEFWDAFSCDPGSPMHLPDSSHVVIW